MKDNRYEIRLSGSGGQGLILAGIILAEAASIHEGKEAVQTQSYGPESRGGASKSEVVISDTDIDYPKVTSPNLLLAMTQEACNKHLGDLREDGIAILDSCFVEDWKKAPNVIALPLTPIAKETTGRTIVANIVALGAITALSGIVSKESMEKAVLARVPKGTEEINLKALNAGFEAAKKAL
ncbi:MAG: 2-oxoacid:ferredoxin oxidoreductase subunit gamma [Armatimonadota bacterium]